jgi:hemerythrin-like domain-containing protein
MISLLLSEHDDFRNTLGNLKTGLREFKSRTMATPGFVERLCEQGVYLIYLMRSHMWVETHGLYKVADKELRLSERQRLIKQILGAH